MWAVYNGNTLDPESKCVEVARFKSYISAEKYLRLYCNGALWSIVNVDEKSEAISQKTYSFSFDGESFTGTFDSVEDAVAEAKEYSCEDHSSVDVGENGEFYPSVDGEWCMDMLREQAANECGESADSYLYLVPKEAEKELTEMLTDTFNEWAKKHGQEPNFYPVNNIKSYLL